MNTALFWEYDSRIGRRWNLDPKTTETPGQSGYSTFNGNPILYADPNGDSGVATKDKASKTITVTAIYVFYGKEATPALATQTAANIQNAFNNVHGTVNLDGTIYKVKFNIRGIAVTKYTESQKQNTIQNERDPRVNYVRLEKQTDDAQGSSYTIVGGNTGFWSTDQMKANKGTTEAHEGNHGFNGLPHPEEVKSPPKSISHDEPSIDMTANSTSFVDPKYWLDFAGGDVDFVVDVTKRKVFQKNIDAIFSDAIKKQLVEKGKANIGNVSNEVH